MSKRRKPNVIKSESVSSKDGGKVMKSIIDSVLTEADRDIIAWADTPWKRAYLHDMLLKRMEEAIISTI